MIQANKYFLTQKFMSGKRYVILGGALLLSIVAGTVFALQTDAQSTSTTSASSSAVAEPTAVDNSNADYVENEKSNLKFNFDSKQDKVKNSRNQLKDQLRCANNFDATAVNGHFAKWDTLITEGRALLNKISTADQGPIPTAWDKVGEIDDL